MAIAAIAGGLARSMGGKMMHSSSAATRSFGSKMLKTSDKKIQGGIDKIAKHTQMSMGLIKKSNAFLGKIAGILSKSSPAFGQQLIIMNKSIKLFLRPIGDIMAKYMRPMAVWMIKFATKWYQLFGTGGAKKGSPQYIEDEIKQLEVERESAVINRDFGKAKNIQEKIEKKQAELPAPKVVSKLEQSEKDFWKGVWKILTLSEDEIIDNIGSFFKKIKDYDIWNEFVVPNWEGMLDWNEKLWDDYIIPGWIGMLKWNEKLWDDYVVPFGKGIGEWAKSIWDDYITEGWKDVVNWSQKIWDDYIVKGWENAKNWASDIWDLIVKNIKSLWGGGDKAVGGPINETGLYKLHAGERVITAGDTARTTSGVNAGTTISMSNNFNINANINSDIDIQNLADRLADLQETELRRRVSYI